MFKGPIGESTVNVRIEILKVVATALCRRDLSNLQQTRRQTQLLQQILWDDCEISQLLSLTKQVTALTVKGIQIFSLNNIESDLFGFL